MEKKHCTDCSMGRTEVTTFITRWGQPVPLCRECLFKRGRNFTLEIGSILLSVTAEGRENQVGCSMSEVLEDRLAQVQENMGEIYATLMLGMYTTLTTGEDPDARP